MLPTGCYAFRISPHGYDKNGKPKVVVALRLTSPSNPSNDGEALVLRTHNDLAYGTADFWDKCRPVDNLHPAFSLETFDSAGCLTVRGSCERYTSDGNTEQWKRFISHFEDAELNTRVDLVLLTGAEAQIASEKRIHGDDSEVAIRSRELRCLRTGSKGQAVEKLQIYLQISADGDFGPMTRKALVEKQQRVGPKGKATGIYSRVDDEGFGLGLLGD